MLRAGAGQRVERNRAMRHLRRSGGARRERGSIASCLREAGIKWRALGQRDRKEEGGSARQRPRIIPVACRPPRRRQYAGERPNESSS